MAESIEICQRKGLILILATGAVLPGVFLISKTLLLSGVFVMVLLPSALVFFFYREGVFTDKVKINNEGFSVFRLEPKQFFHANSFFVLNEYLFSWSIIEGVYLEEVLIQESEEHWYYDYFIRCTENPEFVSPAKLDESRGISLLKLGNIYLIRQSRPNKRLGRIRKVIFANAPGKLLGTKDSEFARVQELLTNEGTPK